jgi:hypothetical protein
VRCEGCGAERSPRDLYDGDLCRACAIARLEELAADLSRPMPKIAGAGVLPERTRGRGAPVVVESFAERDERLAKLPGGRRWGLAVDSNGGVDRAPGELPATDPPWAPAQVSKRLDKAVETPGQNVTPECPVCRRRFTGGRSDRVTCTDHCRDLARRVRQGDPSVAAAIRMLFVPPRCAGCDEPLWGKRPDARYHDAACRKRHQRAALRSGGGASEATAR